MWVGRNKSVDEGFMSVCLSKYVCIYVRIYMYVFMYVYIYIFFFFWYISLHIKETIPEGEGLLLLKNMMKI